jgi:20S proteasome subunit beta 6
VLGVEGEGFVVVGADTRMSSNYMIFARNECKIWQITDRCVLVSSCMKAEFEGLKQNIKQNIANYEFKIGRKPSIRAISNMISKTLYGRRFFPYYTFNLVCGLEEDGTAVVNSYDAIGSYGSEGCGAQGSGNQMMTPWLDSQLRCHPDIRTNQQKAVQTVLRGIVGTCEREIEIGDSADIWVITKDGIQKQNYPLRKD